MQISRIKEFRCAKCTRAWSYNVKHTVYQLDTATDHFYQEVSRELYHKFSFFHPLSILWRATADEKNKTKQKNVCLTSLSVFLHVCLRRGCESGPMYVCHVSGGTVSAMPVWIVMTCFVQFKTHCKLYQSPNKSCWRENTTQDIRPFNDRGLRWRCSGLDWAWMQHMGVGESTFNLESTSLHGGRHKALVTRG